MLDLVLERASVKVIDPVSLVSPAAKCSDDPDDAGLSTVQYAVFKSIPCLELSNPYLRHAGQGGLLGTRSHFPSR